MVRPEHFSPQTHQDDQGQGPKHNSDSAAGWQQNDIGNPDNGSCMAERAPVNEQPDVQNQGDPKYCSKPYTHLPAIWVMQGYRMDSLRRAEATRKPKAKASAGGY
jgi:hypothetical protein